MSDPSVEIRRMNETLKELNKTLNRQNSLLEKMLRMMVVDHQERTTRSRGFEEGEVPGAGEANWPAGSPSRQGQPSLQQGTPPSQGLAQTEGLYEDPGGYQIFGE